MDVSVKNRVPTICRTSTGLIKLRRVTGWDPVNVCLDAAEERATGSSQDSTAITDQRETTRLQNLRTMRWESSANVARANGVDEKS